MVFQVDELPVFKKDGLWFYHPLKRPRSSALDDESIHSDESLITVEGVTDESIDQLVSEEPTTIDENLSEEEVSQIDLETSHQIKSTLPESQSLSDIFFRFFEFLAFELEMEEKVISVRCSRILTRSEKGWGSKRIAVEDPYQGKRNACRTCNSQLTYDYFKSRLRTTLLRFRVGPNELRFGFFFEIKVIYRTFEY